jgi:hypothetical protein
MTPWSGLRRERMNSPVVYLDIETVPNDDMRQFVTVSADDAPKNYKKEEIIAKWVEAEQERRIERMALDVDHARIVAIAWENDGSKPQTSIARNEGFERKALREFWGSVTMRAVLPRFCGYNILGFDLPLVVRRSWVLGVPVPEINMRRYSTEHVVDLMQLLYNWGNGPGPRSRGLKEVAAMYGIENPLPDLDGSKVAEMDDDTLAAYCENDVRMARALAQKMKGWYWR